MCLQLTQRLCKPSCGGDPRVCLGSFLFALGGSCRHCQARMCSSSYVRSSKMICVPTLQQHMHVLGCLRPDTKAVRNTKVMLAHLCVHERQLLCSSGAAIALLDPLSCWCEGPRQISEGKGVLRNTLSHDFNIGAVVASGCSVEAH